MVYVECTHPFFLKGKAVAISNSVSDALMSNGLITNYTVKFPVVFIKNIHDGMKVL